MNKQIQKLSGQLNALGITAHLNKPLAPYTTIKVGGAAALLIEVENASDFKKTLSLIAHLALPYKILGKGSNVIISDTGFEGVVIINNSNHWEILNHSPSALPRAVINSRLNTADSDINAPNASKGELILVRVDSGMRLSSFISALLKYHIYGLEWFSGIPCTVGGALYMNIHGGHQYFSAYVNGAILTDGLTEKEVDHSYFKFDYDWSILHQTKENILSVDLCLFKGNIDSAIKTGKQWAKQKSMQPQKSAGCIFQNLTETEQKKLQLPTPSTGYLIDKVLSLKGKRIGGAQISPNHAAFIENTGNASSSDVVQLIKLVRQRALEKLNLELQLEVELIGNFN
jgi:UDP-N-acetylmuramate dehydrogenase